MDNSIGNDKTPVDTSIDHRAVEEMLEPLEEVRAALSEIDALAHSAKRLIAEMVERSKTPRPNEDAALRRLDALHQRLPELTLKAYERLRAALKDFEHDTRTPQDHVE